MVGNVWPENRGAFLNETIFEVELKVYLFLVSSCLGKVETVTAAVFFEVAIEEAFNNVLLSKIRGDREKLNAA